MCITATVAGLALSAASSISGYIGQQQQAAATEKYNAQVRANAEAARIAEQRAIGMRQVQEQQASVRKQSQNKMAADAAKATATVAASQAGISGNSVFNLIRDIYRQQGDNADAIQFNTDMTVQQLQAEKDATNVSYSNRLSQQQAVSRPSIFKLGLDLAGSYADYKKARA